MQIAGIITEYNPLHGGHVHLMEETRRQLGADSAILCVMSGNFVQRGDFALVSKYARAEAAVRSGADLVLELPLPWAVASAERFADGGVQTLLSTGIVTHLAFGSECGAAEPLIQLAGVLTGEAFSRRLREELSVGVSFAAARQRAAEELTSPETAALLRTPNNILGIEYCKSLLRHGSTLKLLTVPRQGAAHDGAIAEGETPSASAIRSLIESGERERALSLMAPAMASAYAAEEAAGRAPVFAHTCERAILARLRTMGETDFARLDEGREGLYRRVYAAARTAPSVAEVLARAKTKRYAYARLRRMVLWAYLGLAPDDCPAAPPYLRPLAANENGRGLLSQMRSTASVPILTKPAAVRRMGPSAKAVFEWESRAADLYALAYPDLARAAGGQAWKEGPVMC
ncbi:MAG: nucleotidyltransferase family protein [Oscillibacter sp.]|nr:nucleotidyltransferase family protein [Oscillibacter sp.]